MQVFSVASLVEANQQKKEAWREFLRVAPLSMGVYHLKAGQADAQKPHTEDEVYYVVSGRASFQGGSEVHKVSTGSLIFVERLLEHRFYEITEDLTVLVLFAPAEGTLKLQATVAAKSSANQ